MIWKLMLYVHQDVFNCCNPRTPKCITVQTVHGISRQACLFGLKPLLQGSRLLALVLPSISDFPQYLGHQRHRGKLDVEESIREASLGGFLKSPEREHLISTHVPSAGTRAPRRNHPEAGGEPDWGPGRTGGLECGDVLASAKGSCFCDRFSPHRVRVSQCGFLVSFSSFLLFVFLFLLSIHLHRKYFSYKT